MDDMRSSFSRFKKDIKHRLGMKKRPSDRVGANLTEARADPLDSLPRPDHRAATSGHDEEGSRSNADVSQARSSGRADKGNNDFQRRGADADEKEVGQRYSLLDLGIQVAAGSGSNRGIYSSQPSRLLPRTGELGGT